MLRRKTHASWENVIRTNRDVDQGVLPRTYTPEPTRMNHAPLDIKEKMSGLTGKSSSDLRGGKNPKEPTIDTF